MVVTCALVVAVVAAVRGTWSPCGLSMLSAINPMSEAGRGHRYAVTCGFFVTGAALGGLAIGVLCAAAALVVPVVPLVGAVAALVTLAADLRLVRLPTHPRQVDEAWFGRYRRWVYAGGFGAQIGVGFATFIMTAATYLVVVLAVLTGSWAWALTTGLVFGTVRGLAVLVGARARTPQDLRRLHALLARFDRPSLQVAMAVQAAVAVALAATAAPVMGLVVGAVALLALGSRRAVARPA